MRTRAQTIKKLKRGLIQFCDELAKTGELAIYWDGGNDSGTYGLKHNDVDIYDYQKENEAWCLIELAHDAIGYHGFDGNFSTEGTLTYDPETKIFSGTDNKNDPESYTMDDIPFTFKTDLPFDSITVDVSGIESAIDNLEIHMRIKDGPELPHYREVEKEIQHSVYENFKTLGADVLDKIDSTWGVEMLTKDDLDKTEDTYAGKLIDLTYEVSNYSSRNITLDLKEI